MNWFNIEVEVIHYDAKMTFLSFLPEFIIVLFLFFFGQTHNSHKWFLFKWVAFQFLHYFSHNYNILLFLFFFLGAHHPRKKILGYLLCSYLFSFSKYKPLYLYKKIYVNVNVFICFFYIK